MFAHIKFFPLLDVQQRLISKDRYQLESHFGLVQFFYQFLRFPFRIKQNKIWGNLPRKVQVGLFEEEQILLQPKELFQ